MQNTESFVSQSHRSIPIVSPNTSALFPRLGFATVKVVVTSGKILVTTLALATMGRYKIIHKDNGTILFLLLKVNFE